MKVLVVDDEKEIADLVELYLKNDGFEVYNMEKMYVLNGLNEVRLNILTFISIHFY